MAPNQIRIDSLTATSIRLELVAKGQPLGTATGFVAEKSGKKFLMTNWHIVSGRHHETNEPLSANGIIPDEIRIRHHCEKQLGSWIIRTELLYDPNGNRRWIEHPQKPIDVAALPLQNVDGEVATYPLDIALANVDIAVYPAMPVSIIGYPFGLSTAGSWPIWKTGHIASDPDLDYDGRSAFLIDATTRGGMSGSPVVARCEGPYRTQSGTTIFSTEAQTRFLGIYSGRISNEDSEIGLVWRPHLIEEILAGV